MNDSDFPPGWNESRVRKVVDHYDGQTGQEAALEDDEMLDSATHAVVEVPFDLLPAVRKMISKRDSN